MLSMRSSTHSSIFRFRCRHACHNKSSWPYRALHWEFPFVWMLSGGVQTKLFKVLPQHGMKTKRSSFGWRKKPSSQKSRDNHLSSFMCGNAKNWRDWVQQKQRVFFTLFSCRWSRNSMGVKGSIYIPKCTLFYPISQLSTILVDGILVETWGNQFFYNTPHLLTRSVVVERYL